MAKIFAPEGTLLKAGETFSNPDLAECIEWLAEDGARLFLDGDVGQAIVEQQSDGGYLTYADLADYRVARRTPILWQHDGAVVALNPPPAASGALIAFGLGLVQALADARPGARRDALKEAMEATNEARAAHGEGLAAKLADGVLAKNMREAARHPPPIAAPPMSASSTATAMPHRRASPTARATARSSAISASC